MKQLTRVVASRQCEMERCVSIQILRGDAKFTRRPNWFVLWDGMVFAGLVPHPRYVRLVLRFCIDPSLHSHYLTHKVVVQKLVNYDMSL